MNTEKKIWLVSFFFIALFAYGLYSAFRPESYPLRFVRGRVAQVKENVIIGPYPTKEEFRKLRDNLGVEVLVSLMDPASTIEGGFVRKEKAVAKEYGMGFKNFPMDFLNLSAEGNKKQVERVVGYVLSAGDKKLYVHCYLGRHRVKMFAEALAKLKSSPEEGEKKGLKKK